MDGVISKVIFALCHRTGCNLLIFCCALLDVFWHCFSCAVVSTREFLALRLPWVVHDAPRPNNLVRPSGRFSDRCALTFIHPKSHDGTADLAVRSWYYLLHALALLVASIFLCQVQHYALIGELMALSVSSLSSTRRFAD